MAAHPEKASTVAILVEVARRVGTDANAEHPEDIASAMAFAVEYAAITLTAIRDLDS